MSLVSAGSTCLTVNSKTTVDYLNEIPSLNSQLSSCDINVPSQAKFVIKDANVLVTIIMNSGSNEQFYITISNEKVTSFTRGIPSSYSHEVKFGEATFDKILQSNDATDEVLRGILNKDISVRPRGFIGKIKWFFAKFFLPKPSGGAGGGAGGGGAGGGGGGGGGGAGAGGTPATQGPTGQPDFCDDTYLPGHRNYAQFKGLWDQYSSDTDKVCQSQYGRGIPSPCIHSVQLSIEGKPYYLCWYNE